MYQRLLGVSAHQWAASTGSTIQSSQTRLCGHRQGRPRMPGKAIAVCSVGCLGDAQGLAHGGHASSVGGDR